MDFSKISNIILDSDDDEMDDIIAEFAEEERKEQVIQLSESEDEIDNLIEEFAAEIDNLDVEMGATSEECIVATANDVIVDDKECTVICVKNNDNENIYSDKVSDENSFKDTKESCDSIKSSNRNGNFSSSSETDVSKITPDNCATENEDCVDKTNNPPIVILKCESLSSASMSYSCSELSSLTNHSFNNVSKQSIPNKSTNQNHLEEFEGDKTKNSVSSVCNKVPKNSFTDNNGVLDLAAHTADNREYIEICDIDNTYTNTYAISSVEIVEENSSLKEQSDSLDICDVDASSLTINDMSKPSHNIASNNISVTAVPESKSFCDIDTLKSISNRVAEVTVTIEKLKNAATENNQNLVDEGAILLENSTCANSEYNRTNDVRNLSDRESHSKCVENLESNDTKLIAQEPTGVNKDSLVTMTKLNCLKTVTEECVVNTENKTNNDAFVPNSDINYNASQIITSPVLCESPDMSSDVKFKDNSNSVNEKLIISSNIKDIEKNLMSRISEKIYSEESFLKHREKIIVEVQSFISTAYDSSLKKDDVNSIYESQVMDNLELSGNIDKRTSSNERSSMSSDQRYLSKMTQEGTNEIEEQTNVIEEKTNETEERTNEMEVRTNKITVDGASDVYVLHQQESSIISESIQASTPEMLKSDITKNSERNVMDSKDVFKTGISERNKRVLEISESELSCKKLKNDVSSVIDSNESSLALPEDFNSMKCTNKEELVYEIIDVDIKPVDKMNQQIPLNPHWKIEATKKTLDRIALNVSEEFLKKYYETEYSQRKNEVRKLKELAENFRGVTQNLLNVVKDYRSSQKISFADSGFQKVTYRTVGTNVKIRKKERDEQRTLNERKAAEKTPEMVSDQEQQDISPIITILNVSGNVSNQKQDNISPVISVPKASGIVSNQEQENISPVISIPKASGVVSNQEQENISPVISIPKASGVISDLKQDVSSVLTMSKASEIISNHKKQEVPAFIISIPKTSGIISDQKKQAVSPVIVTISKALKIISNQKQLKVSPIITIPKTSSVTSSQNEENISHIKSILKPSGIVSEQNKESVPRIKAIPKVSEIDLPKNSSSSCINLSRSHGGASKLTSLIPTPLPYVMEGNRLVPYIDPSKPSLPSSKPLVMPQTTAVTAVTNCQVTALQREQYEQKGAMSNGVLHPLNSIAKLFQNIQPSSIPQQATLPLQSNSFQNITNHLTQGNIRRVVPFPSQPRQLQFLQMNPAGANVNLNSAANSITNTSAIFHKPHGSSIGIVNHPQKDSQSPLYYQIPRFNPPIPAHQISHVPRQSLSMTMAHSSKVMYRLPNLAHCHPTYVHKKASPVISHPLSLHYNSASANQHHPMSYRPLSVSSHNNPLQLRHPPTSSSSHSSLPVPYIPYLPLGHSANENGRNLLPIPIVKGSLKDDGSVVISWDLPSLEQQSNIAFYQIYSCQVKNPPESPPVWKSVGDVASLDLPMACTLNHFEENTYYYFVVRVIDKLKHCGAFSEPVAIYYSEKNYTSPKT